MADEIEKKPGFVVHKRQQDNNSTSSTPEKKRVVVVKKKNNPSQPQPQAQTSNSANTQKHVVVKKAENPAPVASTENVQKKDKPAQNHSDSNNSNGYNNNRQGNRTFEINSALATGAGFSAFLTTTCFCVFAEFEVCA